MKNKFRYVDEDCKDSILWERIWDEIYAFQKTLQINSLPKDKAQLANMGLYITIGKVGEKLYINKELSRKLFNYRCSK